MKHVVYLFFVVKAFPVRVNTERKNYQLYLPKVSLIVFLIIETVIFVLYVHGYNIRIPNEYVTAKLKISAQ